MDGDIQALIDSAAAFRRRVAQAKRDLGAVDFEWYPYDTISALNHLNRLLTGPDRALLSAPKMRILDVGPGDGELSLLFESLGHEVVAVDHHLYNHNGLRGLRALTRAFSSAVEIHEVDLDRNFDLPHPHYDLVVFLGVLYHLRNPFHVLEKLAAHSSQCLLSTRIARRFPGGKRMPENLALAYLLDDRESNDDDSNYFVFSETGLRVMLERSYWEIRAFMTTRQDDISEPARLDRDERAFCLLKSRYAKFADVELLEGWYDPEDTGWRWTARVFSARGVWNEPYRPRSVTARVFVAAKLVDRCGKLRLTTCVNGKRLAPQVFESPGAYAVVRPVPDAREFHLHFELSHALEPDEDDDRELGLIVESIRIE